MTRPLTHAHRTLLVDGYELPARRRVEDCRPAPPTRTVRLPMSFTDADKYHWMRSHRHSFELLDALRDANSDADFDTLIEAAMRMSESAPSYFGRLDDLARD